MMLSYCDTRQPRMFPDYGPMPPYGPRPRMDPASDVFTCLFGDLFVKWWVPSADAVFFSYLSASFLVVVIIVGQGLTLT